MSTRNQRELRNLAFWAANMVFSKTNNIPSMGFSYTTPEWKRMEQLNDKVSGRYIMFAGIAAAIYIAIAAVLVGLVFIPIMSYAYPDPSKTPSVVFLGGLAVTAVFALGIGLPVSMRLAAALCAPPAALQSEALTDFDRRLARKVTFQIWRMTLIMCGLLVPGAMLLITFNIDAGPLVKWLKMASGAIIVSSMASLYLQERRKKAAAEGGG